MNNETTQKLLKIISGQLGVDESEIKVDSHLQEDLDADQLSIADLLVAVEKEFDVSLDQKQTAKISTVGDILNLITDQTGDV